jgi:hypothetical protein
MSEQLLESKSDGEVTIYLAWRALGCRSTMLLERLCVFMVPWLTALVARCCGCVKTAIQPLLARAHVDLYTHNDAYSISMYICMCVCSVCLIVCVCLCVCVSVRVCVDAYGMYLDVRCFRFDEVFVDVRVVRRDEPLLSRTQLTATMNECEHIIHVLPRYLTL